MKICCFGVLGLALCGVWVVVRWVDLVIGACIGWVCEISSFDCPLLRGFLGSGFGVLVLLSGCLAV